MRPVVSTLAAKVSTLTDAEHRVGALSVVTGVGAFFAFVAAPIAGALAQTAFNAARAALQAVLPEQVDEARRAEVCDWVGTGQNVSAPVGIGIGIATVLAGAGGANYISLPHRRGNHRDLAR